MLTGDGWRERERRENESKETKREGLKRVDWERGEKGEKRTET